MLKTSTVTGWSYRALLRGGITRLHEKKSTQITVYAHISFEADVTVSLEANNKQIPRLCRERFQRRN